MPLASHTRLGRFEILGLLGQGGMGEVYRARDTRLDREVAIKVLPPSVHADPDTVARFEQEARAASALNDPAIVTVFDAGVENGHPYLVTELLQGVTLRQRLDAGPLPLRDALDIAIQTANGLTAAHLKSIVHRDIKPDNVFVTRAGPIKILDFGVARLAGDSPALGVAATTAGTVPGSLVGTVGYMAPEQARGGAVDCRADVFAFGCVLYEMLAGRRAFDKATPLDTIASIVTEEPPDLPAGRGVPTTIERILRRCLKKEPAERFQSAADLAFALTAARDDLAGPQASPAAGLRPASRGAGRTLAWVAASAVMASGALAAWTWTRPQNPPAPSIDVLSVVPPSARAIAPALSPDGKWVAYVGLAQGDPQVFVQFLNGGVPVNLTKGSEVPVLNRSILGGIDIAPDGNALGFAGPPRATGLWSNSGVWLFPAPMGGPPRRVTDRFASIRWSPDGRQLAAVVANPLAGDAVVVSDTDGRNERVIVPAGGGVHLHQVAWSPDGRYIYYAQTLEPNHTVSEIYRAPTAGGPPERVVQTSGVAVFPAPTPDGRALIYAGDHQGEGLNIWRHPLDGSPDLRLTAGAGEYTEPYLSRDGRTMVCLAKRRKGELVRLDVDQASDPPAVIGVLGSGDSEPSMSPASNRLIISSPRNGRRKIWSIDLSGGQSIPLTSGDSLDQRPVMSPNGAHVAFTSNREGQRGVWIVPSDGGTPRPLVRAAVLDRVSWSADSTRLVYAQADGTAISLWTIEASGGAPTRIPDIAGRTPGWAPTDEVIALVRSDGGKPAVHFTTPTGGQAREPLAIDPVGAPSSLAWSPDGSRIAFVNLPGRAAAEVWVLSLADGALRRITELPAPAEFDGITWTHDGRSLIVGRTEYETEVLLLRGLP